VVVVLSPYRQKNTEEIEKIQMCDTMLILKYKHLSIYYEWLTKLALLTVEYKRLSGDMIEMFKITWN
jgi:hypothetical protein